MGQIYPVNGKVCEDNDSIDKDLSAVPDSSNDPLRNKFTPYKGNHDNYILEIRAVKPSRPQSMNELLSTLTTKNPLWMILG